jgi:hypothetical protein
MPRRGSDAGAFWGRSPFVPFGGRLAGGQNWQISVCFRMYSGLDRAKLQLRVYPCVRRIMYFTYDWILIGLYSVISFFLLLFAAYAVREWRFERRQTLANMHAAQAKVRTWYVVRGEWVTDDESY